MKFLESQSNQPSQISLATLWREFLPLSLSDVTMACGDPVMTTTLAHLPAAQQNLAAVGIAKSLAIFFESPIIMILHASNALAPTQVSRQALWRFTLLAGGGLSFLAGLLALPMVFAVVGNGILGIPLELSPTVRQVLMVTVGWAFAIAWRRYFQGLLIYQGKSSALAKASFTRLFAVTFTLLSGFVVNIPGGILAGVALMAGVIVEAVVITSFAYASGATLPPPILDSLPNLPQNLPEVWKFYLPLANSMMVVWGGRTILISILAQSADATIAIASWSAAWGLVLVIANSTRMVQQIVIKYRHQVSDRQLLTFALTVGGACSSLLLLMSATPIGDRIVQSFIGGDRILTDNIKPVIMLCAGVPLLVAIQNATQGFFVSEGQTGRVNLATWLGTGVLLLVASLAIHYGMNGAIAAAIAMVVAMSSEITCLLWKHLFKKP